jgi:hypothetical protein
MKRPLLIGLLLFAALPVAAQTPSQAPGLTPPPGGIIVSPDGKVVVSSTLCTTLDPAAAGVPSAAYQPGVDVNGDSVDAADLPSSGPPMKLDNYPIQIGSRLAGKFNIPAAPKGAYDAKPIFGVVTMNNGRAYFNGEPMSQDQEQAIEESCRASHR